MKVQTTQTVTQAFHAIDLDKSGTLSRAEIIRACREQEKVRLLLGLPRNLRESDGSMAALEAVLKKLNPSEEGVRLAEFVTVFSAPEMRAAVEAASAPPSWLSAVKDAPLFVDGEAKVRSEHGFKHFASEGRFEHTLAEWTDERIESLTSVQTELAQWRCDEKSRQTISADEYANLTKRQEEYLAANSAFPKADRDAEKAKVLANLEQRVALAYRPPSKDQMRRIKAPTSLSPPLGDISALPDQPHGTDAPGGGGGGGRWQRRSHLVAAVASRLITIRRRRADERRKRRKRRAAIVRGGGGGTPRGGERPSRRLRLAVRR